MAKPRHRAADLAVYLIIRMAAGFLRFLPFPAAVKFAGAMAWIFMWISPRRLKVARENLRFAFPEITDEREQDRLVFNMYRHFCRVIVEIIHIDLILRRNNWRDHITTGTAEQFQTFSNVLLSRRPVMIVTGHFGNWELAGYVLGLIGFPGSAIARPLDNPHLDRWMRRWREATGQKMLAKKGEFEAIEQTLAEGRILETLGDQDAGQRGMYVPFFNRPASTHKAIALLAMRHGAQIIVSGCARVGDGFFYRFFVEDIIDPREYDADPDACAKITRRFTEGLERVIRRFPEQYLWVHRRWKHQPIEAKRKPPVRAAA